MSIQICDSIIFSLVKLGLDADSCTSQVGIAHLQCLADDGRVRRWRVEQSLDKAAVLDRLGLNEWPGSDPGCVNDNSSGQSWTAKQQQRSLAAHAGGITWGSFYLNE